MTLYQCHNRPPFVERRVVQDGAWCDGQAFAPRAVSIKNFSVGAECQYTWSEAGKKDHGCDGCTHKK